MFWLALVGVAVNLTNFLVLGHHGHSHAGVNSANLPCFEHSGCKDACRLDALSVSAFFAVLPAEIRTGYIYTVDIYTLLMTLENDEEPDATKKCPEL